MCSTARSYWPASGSTSSRPSPAGGRVDQLAARHDGGDLGQPGRVPERPDLAFRLIARARPAVEPLVRRRVQAQGAHHGKPASLGGRRMAADHGGAACRGRRPAGGPARAAGHADAGQRGREGLVPVAAGAGAAPAVPAPRPGRPATLAVSPAGGGLTRRPRPAPVRAAGFPGRARASTSSSSSRRPTTRASLQVGAPGRATTRSAAAISSGTRWVKPNGMDPGRLAGPAHGAAARPRWSRPATASTCTPAAASSATAPSAGRSPSRRP